GGSGRAGVVHETEADGGGRSRVHTRAFGAVEPVHRPRDGTRSIESPHGGGWPRPRLPGPHRWRAGGGKDPSGRAGRGARGPDGDVGPVGVLLARRGRAPV